MPSFINELERNSTQDPGDLNVAGAEPIAIIGLAIRAADEATEAEAFYDFLLRARQATRPIPEDRLSSKGFYHPDPDHGGTVGSPLRLY